MTEKVFVSSSSKDLLFYRVGVREVLLSMALMPQMMEYFPANMLTGTKTSINYVQESDLFVLILGWRYGLPPAGATISVTEMEYNAALTESLPILVYLADEETRADPAADGFDPDHINTWARSRDPQSPWTWQDLSAKLDAFRNRVSTAHVVKRFKSPAQLATNVATDLHIALSVGFIVQRSLAKAEAALLRRDYPTTKQLAAAALVDLPVSSVPEIQTIAAQAKLLMALALINGQLIKTLPFQIFTQIDELLQQSIAINPVRGSYRYILGDIARQVGEWQSFSKLALRGQQLQQEAQSIPADGGDRRNMMLYQSAQATGQ